MRRVRTQEGVKRFDLPMGSPITAEAILRAKNKRAGGKKGSSGSAAETDSRTISRTNDMLSQANARQASRAPGSPTNAQKISNAEKMHGTGSKQHEEAKKRYGTPAERPRMMDGTPIEPERVGRRAAAGPAASGSTRSPYAGRRAAQPSGSESIATPSTLKGDHKIEVGGQEYQMSADATVRTPKTGDRPIAYVNDPQDNNDLHVLTETGEVPISDATKAAVQEKIDAEPKRFTSIKPEPIEEPSADKPAKGRRAAEPGTSTPKPKAEPQRMMDGTPIEPERGGRRSAAQPATPSNEDKISNAEKMYGTGSKQHEEAKQRFGSTTDTPAPKETGAKISQPKIHEQEGNTWDPSDIGLTRNDAGMIERIPDSTGIAPTPAPDEIEAMRSSPYTSPNLNPDGSFTISRQKLHEQIINNFLDGIEPSANPTQFMNGGGPASGKGGMTRGANAKLTNYPTSRSVDDKTGELETGPAKALLIDPDAIKMQLPEVKQALSRLWDSEATDDDFDRGWAGHSHEESSQLAKRLHTAALQRGIDVIYDGTGNGSVKSVKSKVAAARAAGYRVEANYLFLPPEQGIERAASRAARSKRVVPDIQIRKTYAAIPEIFDGVKDGTFDKVNLFDNRVAQSEPAIHIGATGPDGKFSVLDDKRYKEFMESRHETGLDPAKVLGGDKHKKTRRAFPGEKDNERYRGKHEHSVTLADGTVVKRNSVNQYTHAIIATDRKTGESGVYSFHTSADKAFKMAFANQRGATGARYKFSMQEVDAPDDLQETDSSREANELTDSAKRSRRNGAS